MSVANDNAASVSFEGLVGNLLRAGAIDFAKLQEGFRYVPYEGLSEEVARIQDVKVAFFERFWEPSGKDAVRTLAVAATEVGFFFRVTSLSLFFFACLRRRWFLMNLRKETGRPGLGGLLRDAMQRITGGSGLKISL